VLRHETVAKVIQETVGRADCNKITVTRPPTHGPGWGSTADDPGLSTSEVLHDQVDRVVVTGPEKRHHCDLIKQNLDHRDAQRLLGPPRTRGDHHGHNAPSRCAAHTAGCAAQRILPHRALAAAETSDRFERRLPRQRRVTHRQGSVA
jgi:hypothetical protein